jgi:hypothetical protein
MNTVVQIRKSAVSFGDSISFLFIAQEYSRGALSIDAELLVAGSVLTLPTRSSKLTTAKLTTAPVTGAQGFHS